MMPPLGGRRERIEVTKGKNPAKISRTYPGVIGGLELVAQRMIEAAR